MSSRRLSVRVSQAIERQVKALAKRFGRSESEIVRDALEDYCQRLTAGPTAYDLFKASGLIGCAKGLPSDLSTNPKYMEGFGRD
jgi:ribbon-helix-helix CopG family protein